MPMNELTKKFDHHREECMLAAWHIAHYLSNLSNIYTIFWTTRKTKPFKLLINNYFMITPSNPSSVQRIGETRGKGLVLRSCSCLREIHPFLPIILWCSILGRLHVLCTLIIISLNLMALTHSMSKSDLVLDLRPDCSLLKVEHGFTLGCWSRCFCFALID
jgi:hypothetical protein